MSYSVYCVVFSGMQGVLYFGFWEMGKAFDTTYTLYHSLWGRWMNSKSISLLCCTFGLCFVITGAWGLGYLRCREGDFEEMNGWEERKTTMKMRSPLLPYFCPPILCCILSYCDYQPLSIVYPTSMPFPELFTTNAIRSGPKYPEINFAFSLSSHPEVNSIV